MANTKPVKIALGLLLSVIALNSFGGGWYGMAGAEGVPLEWLEGSPFTGYLIPSVVLMVVVGGSCSIASVLVFKNSAWGPIAAFAAGAILMAWIVVQVSIIGYVSWMQPAVFIAGVAILILSLLLKFKSTQKDTAITV